MIGLGPLAALTAGVTLVAVTATFGVARLRGRYDTIDSFWGPGFALIAVVALPFGSAPPALRLVVAALTVVWGLRLGIHLHLRNHGKPEDPRYQRMVERAGPRPAGRLFVRVYLLQAVILWFVSLPVQFAMYGTGFGVTAWLGVVVWLVGFVFEAVGDEQLRRFRADPANRGGLLDTGLWRYTRHPNYFGDVCVWWGLYLLACSWWPGAATVLSPLVMTFLLVRGTGKPMMEASLRQSRPQYADYVARTSGFLPLPPKRLTPR
ncbi:steroid 5-alpha reductase family enzyme [Amycolatopsis jiangsuensis]|uniref:Steroid 5-alpha reductase family enzyme n=1 Tax=Amycolatopsis jiangsuensis TaxID=1181879 RepID=A0A840IKF4_9PSEU|nr:steroid 5-alpha reductase family enzyme [Amycolatopsis jiangsuensis]